MTLLAVSFCSILSFLQDDDAATITFETFSALFLLEDSPFLVLTNYYTPPTSESKQYIAVDQSFKGPFFNDVTVDQKLSDFFSEASSKLNLDHRLIVALSSFFLSENPSISSFNEISFDQLQDFYYKERICLLSSVLYFFLINLNKNSKLALIIKDFLNQENLKKLVSVLLKLVASISIPGDSSFIKSLQIEQERFLLLQLIHAIILENTEIGIENFVSEVVLPCENFWLQISTFSHLSEKELQIVGKITDDCRKLFGLISINLVRSLVFQAFSGQDSNNYSENLRGNLSTIYNFRNSSYSLLFFALSLPFTNFKPNICRMMDKGDWLSILIGFIKSQIYAEHFGNPLFSKSILFYLISVSLLASAEFVEKRLLELSEVFQLSQSILINDTLSLDILNFVNHHLSEVTLTRISELFSPINCLNLVQQSFLESTEFNPNNLPNFSLSRLLISALGRFPADSFPFLIFSIGMLTSSDSCFYYTTLLKNLPGFCTLIPRNSQNYQLISNSKYVRILSNIQTFNLLLPFGSIGEVIPYTDDSVIAAWFNFPSEMSAPTMDQSKMIDSVKINDLEAEVESPGLTVLRSLVGSFLVVGQPLSSFPKGTDQLSVASLALRVFNKISCFLQLRKDLSDFLGSVANFPAFPVLFTSHFSPEVVSNLIVLICRMIPSRPEILIDYLHRIFNQTGVVNQIVNQKTCFKYISALLLPFYSTIQEIIANPEIINSLGFSDSFNVLQSVFVYALSFMSKMIVDVTSDDVNFDFWTSVVHSGSIVRDTLILTADVISRDEFSRFQPNLIDLTYGENIARFISNIIISFKKYYKLNGKISNNSALGFNISLEILVNCLSIFSNLRLDRLPIIFDCLFSLGSNNQILGTIIEFCGQNSVSYNILVLLSIIPKTLTLLDSTPSLLNFIDSVQKAILVGSLIKYNSSKLPKSLSFFSSLISSQQFGLLEFLLSNIRLKESIYGNLKNINFRSLLLSNSNCFAINSLSLLFLTDKSLLTDFEKQFENSLPAFLINLLDKIDFIDYYECEDALNCENFTAKFSGNHWLFSTILNNLTSFLVASEISPDLMKNLSGKLQTKIQSNLIDILDCCVYALNTKLITFQRISESEYVFPSFLYNSKQTTLFSLIFGKLTNHFSSFLIPLDTQSIKSFFNSIIDVLDPLSAVTVKTKAKISRHFDTFSTDFPSILSQISMIFVHFSSICESISSFSNILVSLLSSTENFDPSVIPKIISFYVSSTEILSNILNLKISSDEASCALKNFANIIASSTLDSLQSIPQSLFLIFDRLDLKALITDFPDYLSVITEFFIRNFEKMCSSDLLLVSSSLLFFMRTFRILYEFFCTDSNEDALFIANFIPTISRLLAFFLDTIASSKISIKDSKILGILNSFFDLLRGSVPKHSFLTGTTFSQELSSLMNENDCRKSAIEMVGLLASNSWFVHFICTSSKLSRLLVISDLKYDEISSYFQTILTLAFSLQSGASFTLFIDIFLSLKQLITNFISLSTTPLSLIDLSICRDLTSFLSVVFNALNAHPAHVNSNGDLFALLLSLCLTPCSKAVTLLHTPYNERISRLQPKNQKERSLTSAEFMTRVDLLLVSIVENCLVLARDYASSVSFSQSFLDISNWIDFTSEHIKYGDFSKLHTVNDKMFSLGTLYLSMNLITHLAKDVLPVGISPSRRTSVTRSYGSPTPERGGFSLSSTRSPSLSALTSAHIVTTDATKSVIIGKVARAAYYASVILSIKCNTADTNPKLRKLFDNVSKDLSAMAKEFRTISLDSRVLQLSADAIEKLSSRL
ncbi:hypothetical protein RCL1_006543 [Eukaryota sp. TZLM3-RCL]